MIKSENITIIEGNEDLGLSKKSGQIDAIIDQIAVPTTSIDTIGDLILLGPVDSNSVILDVEILNDDLDSDGSPTLAVNVGLYYSGIGGTQKINGNTSGTVIDVDCFGSAVTTLQGANTSYSSVRFEADDITDVKKEAWEVAGLSSDPGGKFYVGIVVTTVAATAAAGDIVSKITILK